MMMVKNDIVQYKALCKLSKLDYLLHIEAVNKNIAKMAKDGKGKDSL